jgi:hypothetical protein
MTSSSITITVYTVCNPRLQKSKIMSEVISRSVVLPLSLTKVVQTVSHVRFLMYEEDSEGFDRKTIK